MLRLRAFACNFMKKKKIQLVWEYRIDLEKMSNKELKKFIKILLTEEYNKGYINGSNDTKTYYEKELDNIYN